MDVTFKTVFKGGVGDVTIEISSDGEVIATLYFHISDSRIIPLVSGKLYVLSVTGVSPPGSTELTISHPTTPKTPDTIPAGVILEAYTLQL